MRAPKKSTEAALRFVSCQLSGNREQGTGNREEGTGKREQGRGGKIAIAPKAISQLVTGNREEGRGGGGKSAIALKTNP